MHFNNAQQIHFLKTSTKKYRNKEKKKYQFNLKRTKERGYDHTGMVAEEKTLDKDYDKGYNEGILLCA